MSEEQHVPNQPAKPAGDPNAIKGFSVPPPPRAIVHPLQEGQRVPPAPPQMTVQSDQDRMGYQVPPPSPALVRPTGTPQPPSGGQAPQSTPPPAPTQPSAGGSDK